MNIPVPSKDTSLVRFKDVQAAAARIKGVATRTGLMRSIELERGTGGRVWVKPECLQLSGSFKFRGAYNRVSQLNEREREAGVVAFSSGNHGQGVALAAHMLGVPATIVMPEDAPKIKVERTRSHGAEIVLYDRNNADREAIAREIAGERGAVVVPSYDDVHIIAGQGTAALEAIEDMAAMGEHADVFATPAGGGGLLAGCNLAFEGLSPETARYAAEPENYDDHARSLAAGERIGVAPGDNESICDAILTPMPGEITFAINNRLSAGGVAVSDDEVRAAMAFAFDYLNLVVEPGGVVALAALLTGKLDVKDKTACIILSGGNLDRAVMQQALETS